MKTSLRVLCSFLIGLMFSAHAAGVDQKKDLSSVLPSVEATTAPNKQPLIDVMASLPEWRVQLNDFRSRPKEFKTFVLEILKRRLATDLAMNMRLSGYNEVEIDEVLRSASFKSFASGVLNQPEVKDMIELTLDQVMSVGVIESMVEKTQLQLNEQTLEASREAIRKIVEYQQSKKIDQGFSLSKWIKQQFGALFSNESILRHE